MRFFDLESELRDFVVFSVSDILKIDPGFHRQRLSEWQDKGYLKKIVKGYYIFSDLEVSECTLFVIANKIFNPSYVSLEMAFSYYGLIPEGVYTVTSVSTRTTRSYHTPIGDFDYHCIKESLMFGYRLEECGGCFFKIAEPEKALLDYLYLNPKINDEDDFKEMRINKEVFEERVDRNKLLSYLHLFENREMEKRCDKLINHMQNVES